MANNVDISGVVVFSQHIYEFLKEPLILKMY